MRAPLSGVVEDLRANNARSVIQPGEEVLQIVPVGEELIVESRVAPTDTGHVRPGLPADVKVTSYDPSRFGSVTGTVKRLSATSFLDEQNKPYFLAEITLSAPHLGDDPEMLRIIPGMTVTADIQTGQKSLLAYLIKPVSRGFNTAFRER